MIKKYIYTLVITTFLLSSGITSPVNAQNVAIGLVDSQMVIYKSNLGSALRRAEDELTNLKQNLEKDYMDKVSRLQKIKNQQEFEKLFKQYDAEFKQKQINAQKTLQSKQQNLLDMRESLRKKVETAIKDIAKQKKLTFVVDKQAMYYGGIDITNDVLQKIK